MLKSGVFVPLLAQHSNGSHEISLNLCKFKLHKLSKLHQVLLVKVLNFSTQGFCQGYFCLDIIFALKSCHFLITFDMLAKTLIASSKTDHHA